MERPGSQGHDSLEPRWRGQRTMSQLLPCSGRVTGVRTVTSSSCRCRRRRSASGVRLEPPGRTVGTPKRPGVAPPADQVCACLARFTGAPPHLGSPKRPTCPWRIGLRRRSSRSPHRAATGEHPFPRHG
jgi:hypothetical protein